MCVTIVRTKEQVEFDVNTPLEEQVRGSKQIIVDYHPEDPQLRRFLGEVERILETGVNCCLNIKVVTGKRQNKYDEIMRIMSRAQAEADRKLGELSEFCLKK